MLLLLQSLNFQVWNFKHQYHKYLIQQGGGLSRKFDHWPFNGEQEKAQNFLGFVHSDNCRVYLESGSYLII